jgi:hypothetical protein
MRTLTAIRLYTFAAAVAVALAAPRPAQAQYKPQPLNDPATGETYIIEGAISFWIPTADFQIASAGSGTLSGISGTTIDFKQDLGLTDQNFPAFDVTFHPAKKHKLRASYVPIKYTQSAVLHKNIIFNGQLYTVNLPVNSEFDWNAFRFGYEYDFLSRNRWFAGFIIEAKYTDVQANLNAPLITEFAHAQAPIPAIGGIGRYYIVPNISITGEVSGFDLPDTIDKRYNAHYVDWGFYGTVNFTNNIGAQVGFKSLDVGYVVKADSGTLRLNGVYFGAVLRY